MQCDYYAEKDINLALGRFDKLFKDKYNILTMVNFTARLKSLK